MEVLQAGLTRLTNRPKCQLSHALDVTNLSLVRTGTPDWWADCLIVEALAWPEQALFSAFTI